MPLRGEDGWVRLLMLCRTFHWAEWKYFVQLLCFHIVKCVRSLVGASSDIPAKLRAAWPGLVLALREAPTCQPATAINNLELSPFQRGCCPSFPWDNLRPLCLQKIYNSKCSNQSMGQKVASVHKASWFSFQSVSLVTDSVGGSNDGLTLTKRGIYDPPLKQCRSYNALIWAKVTEL